MKIRLLAVAAVAALLTGAFGQGPKAGADEMLAGIDAVKFPVLDRSKVDDAEYGKQFVAARATALQQRGKLIDDFYRAHPERPKAGELDTNAYPSDKGAFGLLSDDAQSLRDNDTKVEVYRKILVEHPNQKYIPGKIRQIEGLGQRFELSFTDAISGKKVQMSDFRRKIVVIDFWASWCGPCIADLPKLQKMYAELKNQGVEIISVSLDRPEANGGLRALRDFVAKNPMPWFHYYQGNYWDSEFSKSWGISSLPSIFLVDQKGVLVDIDARANLDERVKALLSKS